MKKTTLRSLSAAFGCILCLGATGIATANASSGAGDVNLDGISDSADASDILSAYAALSVGEECGLTEEQLKAADVNEDGTVDSADASDVLDYYSYSSTGGTSDLVTYFSDMKKTEAIDFSNVDPAAFGVTESYSAEHRHLGLCWNPVEGATGYHVDLYTDQTYDENGQPFCFSLDVETPQFTALLPAPLSADNNYRYRITPYAKYGDNDAVYSEKKYVDGSKGCYFLNGTRAYNDVKFKVNTADLKPHDTYAIYDIRDPENVMKVNIYEQPCDYDALWISDSEKEVLNQFAEEHFTPGMTNYDKILCFMNWVHDNLEYATYEQYQEYTLWDGNFVNAVVNLKVGQCLQFNGALAELMSQMGYDVYLVHMETRPGIPHYRMDLNIDGIVYGMEVGDKTSDNPATGYKWMWAFDTNNPMLLHRPDKP